jgi:hypothetical protein
MTRCLLSFSLPLTALMAAPLLAQVDAAPHFDRDAAPILQMQPGLLEYVQARFDVAETGQAKFPGTDEHAPGPPFIFAARPIGSTGPYSLRLLIEPGPPGHILNVVDLTRAHLPQPSRPNPAAVANQQLVHTAPASAPAPTYETPSGPINDSGAPVAPPADPPPGVQ